MTEQNPLDVVIGTVTAGNWHNAVTNNKIYGSNDMTDVIAEYASAGSAFLVADEADRVAQSELLEAQRRAEHASLQRVIASKRVHETRARYEAAMRLAGKPTPPLRTIVDEEVALHDAQL